MNPGHDCRQEELMSIVFRPAPLMKGFHVMKKSNVKLLLFLGLAAALVNVGVTIGAFLMFPAGRTARFSDHRLRDFPWAKSFVKKSREFHSP